MASASYRHRWAILAGLLLLFFLVNISLGSVSIPIMEILRILSGGEGSNPAWKPILLDFRLTKAMTCIIAGSALSIGGLLMQTLFRNPLAGPDILGLSSGASLAVALVIMTGSLGIPFFYGPYAILLAASAGSALVFVIIITLARKTRDHVSLLLIGLMIAALASALVSILQFKSRADDQQYFLIWTFGSLGGLNWQEILWLGAILMVGLIIAFLLIKPLNSWLLGDHYAQSLGVNIRRTRLIMIICTSLLAGSVTAFCGPIAFVGLAVPHLTRLVINTMDHKILIPAVAMGGAVFMLICDTLSQIPGGSFILPINAITALAGAPVVIWVILRSKRVQV
ncbi:MAG: iron ABC transporter permease [Cyclobacteriaceae bacterium]|nr:iron ABC transporter permease [Cyclobacteriaceae bacterium]